MKYKVKMSEEAKVESQKKSEAMLKDLLGVLPTLKKHKLDEALHDRIKKLRLTRKAKSYKLEMSREFNGQTITFTGDVKKSADRLAVMKSLKDKIRADIKKKRAENRPPVEAYTFPANGPTVNKLAEVYLEPGSFFKAMRRKIRNTMLKGSRRPNETTTEPYVGIEIELASKKDRNFICDLLFEADLGKYLAIKDDGSIGNNTNLKTTHPFTHEICILALQSEVEGVVTKLCQLLNDHCEVKVDKTCGLHVHADMRHRDYKKAFANLVSIQHFLYAMCPANRKNSQYSYPVKGKAWRDNLARYHGINADAYKKYKTLEVRIHSGTTDAKKIIGWTRTIIAAVDAPEVVRAPSTTKGLQRSLNLTDEDRKYVEGRIKKFAQQHVTTALNADYVDRMPAMPTVDGDTVEVDTNVHETSEEAA